MTPDSAIWRILFARQTVLRALAEHGGPDGLAVEQVALLTGYDTRYALSCLEGCAIAHNAAFDAASGLWAATNRGLRMLEAGKDFPCPF